MSKQVAAGVANLGYGSSTGLNFIGQRSSSCRVIATGKEFSKKVELKTYLIMRFIYISNLYFFGNVLNRLSWNLHNYK